MKNFLRAIGVLGALGALITGVAASAFAVDSPVLPDAADRLFAMASSGDGASFGSIDVATGAATGLAAVRQTLPGCGDSFTGGAFDASTGRAYVINEIDCSYQTLQSVDPATGALTTIAAMWEGNPSIRPYVRSIAISPDGAAFAVVNKHFLYALNLLTGEVTYIADTRGGDLVNISFNPVDGVLYAIDGPNLDTINTVTGALTFIAPGPSNTCGFQIDTNGVAWFNQCFATLYSATDFTNINGSKIFRGPISIDSVTPRIWSILYVPEFVPAVDPSGGPSPEAGVPLVSESPAVLSITGFDAGAFVLVGGSSAVVLAAGITLVVRRRQGTN